ncbi:MAG TPA: alpha/beta hydrolase [Gemmatimonadaceae bacterium]|nr:alpha/beta hydrolase [Gemmatimonadaceae bacterium]
MRAVLVCSLFFAGSLQAQSVPRAIYTDPPHDATHPARMEVLHIPSGGVRINGVAYLVSGTGTHPTVVIAHGLPGNEKNLDLAQAVRRAGWNAITFNYRGSWGSPGSFRFAQTFEDMDAVLAFLRDPANARRLGVDTARLVIAGHSMGGMVVVQTAAHDHRLEGAILISAADMGKRRTGVPRDSVIKGMAGDMESLAGVTAEQMADEIMGKGPAWRFDRASDGLAGIPLLVLTSDDGLGPSADTLVMKVRAAGNKRVTTEHQATDHSWSDRRIALEAAVIRWLDGLR